MLAPERLDGVSTPVIVAELHQHSLDIEYIDDRADLSSAQQFARLIFEHSNDIVWLGKLSHVFIQPRRPSLENIARDQARHSPRRKQPKCTNLRGQTSIREMEISAVALTIFIAALEQGRSRRNCRQNGLSQPLGIHLADAERSLEDTGFVPTSRVTGIEAIVGKLPQLNDRQRCIG